MRRDILEQLGAGDLGLTCAAVCVYPSRVKDAVDALKVRCECGCVLAVLGKCSMCRCVCGCVCGCVCVCVCVRVCV